LIGEINGANTVFYTRNAPLADTNFDKQVTPEDIAVYGWVSAGDPSTKQPLAVASVYAPLGRITLSSAPSGFEVITCDYAYYLNEIDFTLVSEASKLYAAFLYTAREMALLPVKSSIGPLRTDFLAGRLGTQFPHQRFYERYLSVIRKIRTKPYIAISREEVTEHERRELREYVPWP
jgi:hypothetical protein